MKKEKLKGLLHQIFAILILLGTAGYYFKPEIAQYIVLVGVAGFGSITLTTRYPGKSIRGKRLFNMQVFAVILMIIATYLMFIEFKEWVLAMLIAAILILYSSFVLSAELNKEKKQEEEEANNNEITKKGKTKK